MYQPYRGQRSQRQRFIRNFVVVVLCAFIAACAVFLLFFQDAFVQWRQEYAARHPQAADDATPEKEQNPAGLPADPQTPEGPAEATNPDPDPAPAVSASVPKTIEIPADKTGDDAYLAQAASLSAKGFNRMAFTVIDSAGGVLDPAQSMKAIGAAHGAGMKASAILYTFQNNAYAAKTPTAALKNIERKVWRMGDGARWLDPASEDAMFYVNSQVQLLKSLGYDEVILRGFGWPPAGRLGRIVYGDSASTGAGRADLLAARLQRLAQNAAPMEVSVVLDDPAAPNGLNDATGQDVAKLYPLAARLYVPMAVQTETSGDSIRTILSALTGDASKITPMYTSAALAPTLFQGDAPLYFTSSETGGALDAYLS